MANKRAGQKMKYTKAFTDYNRTDDEGKKLNALRLMATVIRDAPLNGFSENDVTEGKDIPAEVRHLIEDSTLPPSPVAENPEQLVRMVEQMVDVSELQEEGGGEQAVYAYGYRCAPDRLKVGRSNGDVIMRVTQQITTSTPDKPSLFLIFRTQNCRALEMALHGIMQVQGRKVLGGGDEWYQVTRQELLEIYRMIRGRSDCIADQT